MPDEAEQIASVLEKIGRDVLAQPKEKSVNPEPQQ
jgi:hypothetical protein